MDSLRATELRLGLPGTEDETQKPAPSRGSKRALAGEQEKEEESSSSPSSGCAAENGKEVAPPPTKAQVVGWPPIRSFRKNCLLGAKTEAEAPGLYVKVSMDGAPYLRKIDLKSYSGYKELRQAMEAMFKCFSSAEGCCSSEYAITYEDKDGDWMLAGDVPWEYVPYLSILFSSAIIYTCSYLLFLFLPIINYLVVIGVLKTIYQTVWMDELMCLCACCVLQDVRFLVQEVEDNESVRGQGVGFIKTLMRNNRPKLDSVYVHGAVKR
ncbi:hypothetical protein Taro_034479 [Colocasia esculenta]|uniref:Auxin-responsive protein n=1 Tax=Colocasia esculenta TaxID=4460 RepID=A0A843WC19_COLES|nr:hypothetical protein [Colocasia esculenta]